MVGNAPPPTFMLASWRRQRDIDDGLAREGRSPARVRRRRAAAERAGVERTWSAAPCATRCSGADGAELDLVVDGEQGALSRRSAARRVVYDRFETATVAVGVRRGRRRAGAHRELSAPGRAAEVRPAALAEDLGAARLHGQRARRAARRSGSAGRSARRASTTSRRAAPRAARPLVRRRPDPGPAGRPLCRPAGPRAGAADDGPLLRDRAGHRLPRPGGRRAREARRGGRPRARLRAARAWGLVPLGPARGELIEAVAACCHARRGRGSRGPGQ